jgi:UDP-glucose 4-epimerase
MRALVTGGAGFIGSHIVERLLADGFEVRVLDDFSTGHRENLPAHPQLTIIEGDVADLATVRDAVSGCDWVFHEAAIASVPRTIADPLASARVNYLGTLHVLEAARLRGVKRVVFAASASAYGDLPEQPKREDSPIRPLSPYAVDKLASEQACQAYHYLHGLETVCLRYFNVYGERQDPSSPYSGVISIFVERLLAGETPTIYGDGGQTRDFVYVGDVVEANLRAARTPGIGGSVINIATGQCVELKHMLATLSTLTGQKCAPHYAEARSGDIRHSSADVSCAANLLGWRATTGLSAGLTHLLECERHRLRSIA